MKSLCTYYTIGSVKLIFIKKLINFKVYEMRRQKWNKWNEKIESKALRELFSACKTHVKRDVKRTALWSLEFKSIE